jgi:hypothetical protein
VSAGKLRGAHAATQTARLLIVLGGDLGGSAPEGVEGWSALQLVTQSQIECMEAWLDSERCRDFTESLPRSQHRATGIFREFWGLEYVVHMPSPVPAILRGFHNGGTRDAGSPAIAPAFDAFRRRADKTYGENIRGGRRSIGNS